MPTLLPHTDAPEDPAPRRSDDRPRWWRRPVWRRFTAPQCLVLALASIAPAVIAGALAARALGLTATDTMVETALAAGEDPGLITFGAMYLASPVQWLTGRSQVRVRKFLGIVFFLLAASNAAMFAVERGVLNSLDAPFLVAGTLAFVASIPLFFTSSHRAQRLLGMHRWRTLHRLTHLVAIALVAHVVLIGEFAIGAVLIALGAVARIPAVRARLTRSTR